MRALLAELGRGLSDVVFPPICVHCRGIVPSEGVFRAICPRCEPQIERVRAPHCTTCGHPFYGECVGERMCPHCEGLAPAYREGRTAVLLKGVGRALVHELKYHRGLHVLRDLEEIFRQSPHVLALVREAWLVPVPLHPRKQRERGYNQSALVAECLANAAGGATRVVHLLSRELDTVSQTKHDRKTRQANLRNAFALAKGASITADRHLVLVDDVFTTGSTLNSCALTLRRAGALNLDVVTFGHG